MRVKVEDFDYQLPTELIAQTPVSPRDAARLLVIDRETQGFQETKFKDLPNLLTENDVLVINQSKVFPARLKAKKMTGGGVEILLLSELTEGVWEALSKPGLVAGTEINFTPDWGAQILEENNDEGVLKLKMTTPLAKSRNFKKLIEQVGLVPLPPYIQSVLPESRLRLEYQTVYASEWGSAAAPTAGMHFTKSSLKELADNGVGIVPITLHVGLGTFQPVNEAQVEKGSLHQEKFCLSRQTANQILEAKRKGKRIIAVGTTSARALESAARMENGELSFMTDWQETRLFIKPPYQFKVVDSLITNFHLPKSSLLMLVTALVTKPNTDTDYVNFASSLMGKTYQKAIEDKYRFFSFGDAMWIK